MTPIIYNIGPPIRTYSKNGATIHVWGDGMVTRHTEEGDEWWVENE